MKVIAGAGRLPDRFSGAVVAIGVFDAVHRGHQKVIARAVAEARRLKTAAVVLSFHPHPVEVLRPDAFSGYATTLDNRLRCMAALGVDVCAVIPFTAAFAQLLPRQFVEEYLVRRLRAVKVVVGQDFHFGHERGAVAEAITSFAPGVAVERIPILKLNSINIKTKYIKQLIANGDFSVLKRCLGRDHGILAEVESGFRLGRRLGFPTANLKRENVIIPPCGIYLSRVTIGHKKHAALFYIGHRPTVARAKNKLVLEVHILDFKGRLYGKKILAEFLKKLRDEAIFPDEECLARAIARDVARARSWFASHPV